MMITEAEAKTKWCPLARASSSRDETGASVNRGYGGTDKGTVPDIDCMCIASACMAWRPADIGSGLVGSGFCGAFGRP